MMDREEGQQTRQELRLAVLIDADNIPHIYVTELLEEAAKYGLPTFKRIYGDWTRPHIAGWKNVLLENAITPVQQYSYTVGKNATDAAMIIDAMDILYSGRVDGFCIVSSDSDFTRLAIRLREAGKKVFGFGERKTPTAFTAACDKFVYIEILKEATEQKKRAARGAQQGGNRQEPVPMQNAEPITADKIRLIAESIDDLADEDGWAFLGEVGNLILKKQPSFDPRNYGFPKLMPLVKSLRQFEVYEMEVSQNRRIKHVYVRNR